MVGHAKDRPAVCAAPEDHRQTVAGALCRPRCQQIAEGAVRRRHAEGPAAARGAGGLRELQVRRRLYAAGPEVRRRDAEQRYGPNDDDDNDDDAPMAHN